MVDRIQQTIVARGASPSTRFANAQTFAGGFAQASDSISRSLSDVSNVLERRAIADAEVDIAETTSNDTLQLENGLKDAARDDEAGARDFTNRMNSYFNKFTEKRRGELKNDMERRAYDKWRNTYRTQFIREANRIERTEARRHTIEKLQNSAENYSKLFQGYDKQRIDSEAPAAIAQQEQAILNSPLSPADKAQLLENQTALMTEAAWRSRAQADPTGSLSEINATYEPTIEGAAEFILDREGEFAPADGPRGTPAIFGINRESWPKDHDEVMALYNDGKVEEARNLAKTFYKEKIIKANDIDKMPPDVALVVADGVTNHRPKIQKKLVEMAKAGATADELIEVRQEEYDRLNQFPQHQGNYKGWMARLQHVRAAVGNDTAVTGNPIYDNAPTVDLQIKMRQIAEQEQNRQQTKYKAVLMGTVEDNLALARENGTTDKIEYSAFERAYGDAAALKYREYNESYTYNKTLFDVKTARPDEIKKILQNKKPQQGPGFADAQKNYAQVQKAALDEVVSRSKDPMTFAIREGFSEVEELDFGDPQQLGLQLSLRSMTADAMVENYQTPYKPLTESEAQGLAATIPTMSIDQQLQLIGTMRESFKDKTPTVMRQLGGKDDIFAHVGAMLSLGGDPQVARNILRGREYAAANKDAVAKTGMDDWFREYVGGSLATLPKSAAGIKKSADNLYIIKALQNGKATEPDKDLYIESINEVMGAKGYDAVHELNGSPFILPVGKTPDQFDTFLDTLDDDALKVFSKNGKPPTDSMGRPVTADQIREYATLVTVGNGEYAPTFPNGALLAGGEPYVLRIR